MVCKNISVWLEKNHKFTPSKKRYPTRDIFHVASTRLLSRKIFALAGKYVRFMLYSLVLLEINTTYFHHRPWLVCSCFGMGDALRMALMEENLVPAAGVAVPLERGKHDIIT